MSSEEALGNSPAARLRAWTPVFVAVVAALASDCGGDVSVNPSIAASRVIRMVPWVYMPSADMEISEENPFPREAIRLLAREWERLHPGVRIEFMVAAQEQSAYLTWVETQCRGGTIPEIIFYFPPGDKLANQAWVLPLDTFLEQPNKYVPGNRHWRDLIVPACLAPPWMAQDGHNYFIPVDIFMTSLFYNTAILEKAGVHLPIETWAEFMDAHRRIREAGYEPFWSRAMWSLWPRELMGQLMHDEPTFRRLDVLDPNGRIDPEENARGAYLDIIGIHESRFHEYLRLMKEWSRYWKTGFSFNKSPDSVNLFRAGRLGISWDGALNLSDYENDPYVTFDFELGWFPPMTKASSPFASARTPERIPVPGTCFYVTQSAVDNDLLEPVLDWLMFLTTPGNVAKLTQEETGIKIPPAILGAKVDPVLAPVLAQVTELTGILPIYWGLSPEAEDNFDRIFELYLMDELTLEQALARMAKWTDFGVREAIRDNQTLTNPEDRWDLSRW